MERTDKFSGRKGHEYDRDHAATTHLESYNAYEAHAQYSGFSGHGWAVMDSATGEKLGEFAWRNDALREQAEIEAKRAADKLQTRRVFEARIADEIRAEAERLGVNPHYLVDGIRGYVTLRPGSDF